MIHKKVIDAIYKKCRKRPASPDELNIPLLFEKLPEEAMIEVDGTAKGGTSPHPSRLTPIYPPILHTFLNHKPKL